MEPTDTKYNRRLNEVFSSCAPPKAAENTYARFFLQLCQPELFEHLKGLGYHPINDAQHKNTTYCTFQGGDTFLRLHYFSGDVCISPGRTSPTPLSKLEKLLRDLHLHPVNVSFGSNRSGIDDYGRIN